MASTAVTGVGSSVLLPCLLQAALTASLSTASTTLVSSLTEQHAVLVTLFAVLVTLFAVLATTLKRQW